MDTTSPPPETETLRAPRPVKEVANTLWELCGERGFGLPCHLKLQKLVYFANGWHLAYTDAPLIDGGIQAWAYGPVSKDLYHAAKGWEAGEIMAPFIDVNFDGNNLSVRTPKVEDPDLKTFLGNIISVYGAYSAIQLSNMTHEPDTPWFRMKSEFPNQDNLTIPDNLMAAYFKSKLNPQK